MKNAIQTATAVLIVIGLAVATHAIASTPPGPAADQTRISPAPHPANAGAKATSAASTHPGRCDKCAVVQTRTTSINSKGHVVHRKRQVMRCPDCRSALANLFRIGQFKHTCSNCGEQAHACDLCR